MSREIQTQVFIVDSKQPESQAIERGAEIIRQGGLVAFPTETVYGLGADAFNEAAVKKIFEAKGRPATNPVIVHVGTLEAAAGVCREWPDRASVLAAAFWPGPLTMVLQKSRKVPGIVTAGRESVAVRMPAHPVAAALLKAADIPVAAPSANRSSEISPTRAEHVLKAMNGRIDAVLDGGATNVGIESTVVDLTGETITILRPGSISRAHLESVLKEKVEFHSGQLETGESAAAPGMLARHYAPCARVEILESQQLIRRLRELPRATTAVGVLARTNEVVDAANVLANSHLSHMPPDFEGYAIQLYSVLHELDDRGLGLILIESPPNDEEWHAIHDRLSRMSHADRPE